MRNDFSKKVAMSLAAFERDLTVADLYPRHFEELARDDGKGLSPEEQRMLSVCE